MSRLAEVALTGSQKKPICRINLRAGPGDGGSKGPLFKGGEEFAIRVVAKNPEAVAETLQGRGDAA